MASLYKDFEEVFAMYMEDLEEDLPASTGAMKAGVVAKTKKFAEALESLNTEDTHAMKADFEEVFKLFKDDLKEITEPDPEEKDEEEKDEEDRERASEAKGHASLAKGATGVAAKKASIVAKTKKFAKALESHKDFEEAFAKYKKDLGEELPGIG